LGDLGVTYMVHLLLVGKRVVDFLLALIELLHQLSRLRRYERIVVEIVLFKRGWITLSANLRGEEGRPPRTLGDRKLESMGYHVVLFA